MPTSQHILRREREACAPDFRQLRAAHSSRAWWRDMLYVLFAVLAMMFTADPAHAQEFIWVQSMPSSPQWSSASSSWLTVEYGGEEYSNTYCDEDPWGGEDCWYEYYDNRVDGGTLLLSVNAVDRTINLSRAFDRQCTYWESYELPGETGYSCTEVGTATGIVPFLADQSNAVLARIQCFCAGSGQPAGGQWIEDSVTVLVGARMALAVTPDAQAIGVSAFATATQTFSVKNLTGSAKSYALVATCGPPAADECVASQQSLTNVAPNEIRTVTVSYRAGAPSTSGTIRLRASSTQDPWITDDGSVTVTVGASLPTTTMQVRELNAGTSFDRRQCLTFAIVPDVASECGALRITHELPAVRTLGTRRAPTMVYYSDQLQAPLLSVNVMLADTTTTPEQVELVLYERTPAGDTVRLQTRTFVGSAWASNRRQRVAVPVTTSRNTGIVRYRVAVNLVSGGIRRQAAAPVDGELAVVSREDSPFNAGWWLAGLERLHPVAFDNNAMLWVGGDGSTRKYVNRHTLIGADTVYTAESLFGGDTLLHRSDGRYQRQLGNRAYVEFDRWGYHVGSVNRLGYRTAFRYDSTSAFSQSSMRQLRFIQLPPWRGAGGTVPSHAYEFVYSSANGRLDSIIAPAIEQDARNVVFVPAPSDGVRSRGVVRIEEHLGSATYAVSFGFVNGSEFRYARRDNREGLSTTFGLVASSPLVTSFETSVTAQNRTQLIRHSFNWAAATLSEAQAPPQPAAVADLVYDGPRPIADATSFWLDRFGAPVRIVDALNRETTLSRGDVRFPGLVTAVRRPNGFTTVAVYDGRGNVLLESQLDPYGDGRNATTTYQWHPSLDVVSARIGPEGETSTFGYDAVTGHRLWQEDGRGAASRVNFTYYTTTDETTGAMSGLLESVILPEEQPWQGVARSVLTYDSAGNLKTTKSPRNAVDTLVTDALGRVLTSIQPMYADSVDRSLRNETRYDLRDLVVRQWKEGTVTNSASSVGPRVLTETFHSPEGHRDSLRITQFPDAPRLYYGNLKPAMGAIVHRWRYDPLGRIIAELAPDTTGGTNADNPFTETFYDEAGNVDSVLSRRRDPSSGRPLVVRMEYDHLNRLQRRTTDTVPYNPRWLGVPDRIVESESTCGGVQGRPYPRFGNVNNTLPSIELSTCPGTGYTVPADTAAFAYDMAGNLVRADNAEAFVRRRYFPNGQLQHDSLRILRSRIEDSRDTLRHRYGLQYRYDRSGRVASMLHPQELAPVVGAQRKDEVEYTFYPAHGGLYQIEDPLDHLFRYTYTKRGQIDSLGAVRNGVSEAFRYDPDGNLARHTVADNSTPLRKTLRDVTMHHTLLGQLLHHADTAGFKDTMHVRYDGLGQMVSMERSAEDRWYGDPYDVDAGKLARFRSISSDSVNSFGNRIRNESYTEVWIDGALKSTSRSAEWSSFYEPGTGRLLKRRRGHAAGGFLDDTLHYDAGGNVVASVQGPTLVETPLADRLTYHDAQDRLRAVDFRTVWSSEGGTNAANYSAFDEYGYDALGRRVWVRSRRNCDPSSVTSTDGDSCNQSYVRRTVWAGDQELYEIQMPDDANRRELDELMTSLPCNPDTRFDPNMYMGRVAYTHGMGIDRPLSVTRINYTAYDDCLATPSTPGTWRQWEPFTIVPLWNQQGNVYSAFIAEGQARACPWGSVGSCAVVAVPGGGEYTPYRKVYTSLVFHGTLILDKSDATGQLFRRNRFYDPSTGRFTQQDPIGLAGGLNLYGYAGGDPVNHSDPFGLCSIPSAAANVIIGAAISAATGSSYGLGAAALDVASGCVGMGTLGKAAKLAGIIRANKRAGDAFEAALGIASRGKTAIPSISGTAARRFPDEMTDLVLREAKSGSNIKLTNQIQDFIDYAKDNGRQFILEVRESAKIDQRLLDLEKAGSITIRRTP